MKQLRAKATVGNAAPMRGGGGASSTAREASACSNACNFDVRAVAKSARRRLPTEARRLHGVMPGAGMGAGRPARLSAVPQLGRASAGAATYMHIRIPWPLSFGSVCGAAAGARGVRSTGVSLGIWQV